MTLDEFEQSNCKALVDFMDAIVSEHGYPETVWLSREDFSMLSYAMRPMNIVSPTHIFYLGINFRIAVGNGQQLDLRERHLWKGVSV